MKTWDWMIVGMCLAWLAALALLGASAENARAFAGSQTTAAWVQAFGSIAAIIGTWAIAEGQARRERTRLEEARQQAIHDAESAAADRAQQLRRTALALAELATNRLTVAARNMEGATTETVEALISDLEYTRELIQGFAVHELDTSEEMLGFSAFGGILGISVAYARHLREKVSISGGWTGAYLDLLRSEMERNASVAQARKSHLVATLGLD